MHHYFKHLALTALLSSAAAANSAVLITEFIADPTGTDVDREWMEIYNNGASAVNLTGYAAGDGTDPLNMSGGEAMQLFPNGTIINPGQVMVLAANANGFNAFYGFLPNFEFANNTSGLGNNPGVPDLTQVAGWGIATGTLGIANGGDDVGLLASGSTPSSFTFLDGSNHGTVTTFFPGAATLAGNQSYERINGLIDTDTASDWVVRTTGNATPGVVVVPEPAALWLLMLAAVPLLRRRK